MQWIERKKLQRRNLWKLRDGGMKERCNEGRTGWPRSGSQERTLREREMRWKRGEKMSTQDEQMLKDGSREEEKEGERDEERSAGEAQRRRETTTHQHILSHVLIHSSASSSSSSSFNCSSPESDEVFSEGEDTTARSKIMKRVSVSMCVCVCVSV